MNLVKKSNAAPFLFFNAFLWGSSYIWTKMLLSYVPRFTALFFCAFGSLIFMLAIFLPQIKTIKAGEILPCLKISMFSAASNICCIFALQYTSGSNTAFIVQLSVIITPILMAVAEKRRPKPMTVISAVTALAGLFLLTCDFKTFRFNPGDLFALFNALFFSIYLLLLEKNSGKTTPVHYTFIQYLLNSVVFMAAAAFLELGKIRTGNLKSPVFIALIAASIFISLATVLIQSAAIRFVRPDLATLIYTFEPVTAMILGYIFLAEKSSGAASFAGFIMIFLSVVGSLYNPKVKRESLRLPRFQFRHKSGWQKIANR